MKFKILYIVFLFLLSAMSCDKITNEKNLDFETRGDLQFKQKNYTAAVSLWKKSLEDKAGNASIFMKLVDCFFKLGRLERANFFLLKAVDIDPNNLNYQIKLAQINILTGNLKDANQICKKLDKKNIQNSELFLLQADIFLFNDNMEMAEKFYRKALSVSKNSLRSKAKLAIFLKSVRKNKEADQLFDIIKQTRDKSSDIHLLISSYYLLGNDTRNAEKAILKAVENDPADNVFKYHLIQFYISTDLLEKAKATIEKLLFESPDDLPLKMMLCDVLIQNNELPAAEVLISKLKSAVKDNSTEFELLQGKFWLFSGNMVYANLHFKSAIDINPGLFNAYYLLAFTHLANGKIKLSENNLVRTLALAPNHYSAIKLIATLLYKKKEYDLSLKYLERLLKKHPEDFSAHIFRGLNLIEQKKYAAAEKSFLTAFYLSPDNYLSTYYLGLTKERQNDGLAALGYYEKIISSHPELFDVSFHYLRLLVQEGFREKAQNFIQTNLETNSTNPVPFYQAAKIALKMNQPDTCLKYFEKAISFDRAPGYIYIEFSRFYKTQKQFDKAVDILKTCIKKYPRYKDARIALSHFYLDNNDVTNALAALEDGFAYFSQDPVFQGNLAWLLLSEKHRDENRALSLAKNAYEKLPNSPAIADTLGWAYYHKGLYVQAIWVLTELAQKEVSSGIIKFHLGMSHYKHGDIKKAKELFEKSLLSQDAPTYRQKVESILFDLNHSKES